MEKSDTRGSYSLCRIGSGSYWFDGEEKSICRGGQTVSQPENGARLSTTTTGSGLGEIQHFEKEYHGRPCGPSGSDGLTEISAGPHILMVICRELAWLK